MNNALNGRKLKELGFALLALSVDPREVGELLIFLRLLSRTGSALAGGFHRYSTADQLDFSDDQARDEGHIKPSIQN